MLLGRVRVRVCACVCMCLTVYAGVCHKQPARRSAFLPPSSSSPLPPFLSSRCLAPASVPTVVAAGGPRSEGRDCAKEPSGRASAAREGTQRKNREKIYRDPRDVINPPALPILRGLPEAPGTATATPSRLPGALSPLRSHQYNHINAVRTSDSKRARICAEVVPPHRRGQKEDGAQLDGRAARATRARDSHPRPPLRAVTRP